MYVLLSDGHHGRWRRMVMRSSCTVVISVSQMRGRRMEMARNTIVPRIRRWWRRLLWLFGCSCRSIDRVRLHWVGIVRRRYQIRYHHENVVISAVLCRRLLLQGLVPTAGVVWPHLWLLLLLICILLRLQHFVLFVQPVHDLDCERNEIHTVHGCFLGVNRFVGWFNSAQQCPQIIESTVHLRPSPFFPVSFPFGTAHACIHIRTRIPIYLIGRRHRKRR